jgi:hypothetical protein
MVNKKDFNAFLWRAVQAFWLGDLAHLERLLDHLALECTDDQWQIVDDTFGLLEDPTGYIVSEVPLETPTSPFNAITE